MNEIPDAHSCVDDDDSVGMVDGETPHHDLTIGWAGMSVGELDRRQLERSHTHRRQASTLLAIAIETGYGSERG